MMVFDSHLHLFNAKIIENVSRRKGLADLLDLETAGARLRLEIAPLAASMKAAGVAAGLILPTAAAAEVKRVNSFFIEKRESHDFLHTAGTLHPDFPHNRQEIDRLCLQGVRGIKLCSFSQGFVLDGPPALALFDLIDLHNRSGANRLFVVLDTFYHAHHYFGSHEAHTTKPAQIAALARRYPQTVFIGAHMGGLTAPFEQLWSELSPCDNLLLDTSNAAHTLSQEQFVALLKRFGSDHIVFGTDWPWFVHGAEIARIKELTGAAGFSAKQTAAVFYDNMAQLLAL
jgi:predicted TIM-barrel fold metal-dependent hydrolase